MDKEYLQNLWSQFGASFEMMENLINDASDEIWESGENYFAFWYVAYHTIFWCDFYLTPSPDEFKPHDKFGLTELDPAGLIPETSFTKEELISYLAHCRKKCKTILKHVSDEELKGEYKFGSIEMNYFELLLYNLRHLQHHFAQLNHMMRIKDDKAARWIKKSSEGLFPNDK